MTTPAERPATLRQTAACGQSTNITDAIQRLATALAYLSSGNSGDLAQLNNAHTQLRAAGDIIGEVDTWVRDQIAAQERQLLAEIAAR